MKDQDDIFLNGRIEMGKSEKEYNPLVKYLIKSNAIYKDYKQIPFDDVHFLKEGDMLRIINDRHLLNELRDKERIAIPDYHFLFEQLGQIVTILKVDSEDPNMPIKICTIRIDQENREIVDQEAWIPLDLIAGITYLKKRE